ncbi:BLUF domain-containing protein [Shimia sp. R11_0]|nr:BLUF domain-containing protein [Shimia sp. R11_0]
MIEFVVFRSRCVRSGAEADELSLLKKAISFNSRAGLSGFLLRTQDHYFQEMEGPVGLLGGVVDSIIADPRHEEFTLLSQGLRRARQLANWDLGYWCSVSGIFGGKRITCESSADEIIRCVRHVAELLMEPVIGEGRDVVYPPQYEQSRFRNPREIPASWFDGGYVCEADDDQYGPALYPTQQISPFGSPR